MAREKKQWTEQREMGFAVLAVGDSEWLNMEFLTEEGKTEAKRIRDRLIQEVSPEAQGLLSGEEEILVPYQGWHEEEREFHANQRYQFKQSIKEGDPSLKALMPELFPPVSLSKTGC